MRFKGVHRKPRETFRGGRFRADAAGDEIPYAPSPPDSGAGAAAQQPAARPNQPHLHAALQVRLSSLPKTDILARHDHSRVE
ncbi:hypothetical protein GCM10023178_41850 [Actinomadura luteofluorescens]